MARNENPPFERGALYWDPTYVPSAQEITDTMHLEGKEWTFEDVDYSQRGAKPLRTGREVRCRCVRNTSAGVLLPKRLVRFEVDAVNGTDLAGRVNGYTATTAQRGYPVDEWLPVAGVPVNHLFWIVMEGPSMIKSDLASGAANLIAPGDVMVALTGTTSGASNAGRVGPQDLTGATGLLGAQIQNRVGYAMSNGTTGNTDRDVLVDVTKL